MAFLLFVFAPSHLFFLYSFFFLYITNTQWWIITIIQRKLRQRRQWLFYMLNCELKKGCSLNCYFNSTRFFLFFLFPLFLFLSYFWVRTLTRKFLISQKANIEEKPRKELERRNLHIWEYEEHLSSKKYHIKIAENCWADKNCCIVQFSSFYSFRNRCEK